MEPIKVNVSIELNLSEDFKNFVAKVITDAFSSSHCSNVAKASVEAPVEVSAPKVEAPVISKPATPSVEKPKEVASAKVSIEDVRKALASKVADHRAEIKDKLNELGAPSVTKLEPAKYQEMLDFLNTLD